MVLITCNGKHQAEIMPNTIQEPIKGIALFQPMDKLLMVSCTRQ